MTRQRTVNSRNIDMTSGPLFTNILRFIFPLIVTNLLQQFYNAADIMIVGLSSEPDAVGAVGSTSSYLSLITNLVMGFSIGTNVVVAHHIGAKDKEKTEKAVHTSICISLILGVLGMVVGIALTRVVLVSMGYTGNLLILGIRYSYIYLACLPFLSLTNFLSSILRADGNTKTTLYVMSLAGLLNIGLNFFFVIALDLSVEGVAIATAIANLVSACALWWYLAKKGGNCKISMKKLKSDKEQFVYIFKVGLPAGIQNSFFSISNILIQSSIVQINNAITPVGAAYAPVIKGNTATGSLESFIFTALGATTGTASAFTAQNAGAGNYRRVKKAFFHICLISAAIAIGMTALGLLFRIPLLSLYDVTTAGDLLATITLETAVLRMIWKWPGFFIYSMMNACAGTIRGLGKSTLAAVITFFGTCVFRIVWVYTAFRAIGSLEVIYISYPISWLLTGICFMFFVFGFLKKKIGEEDSLS